MKRTRTGAPARKWLALCLITLFLFAPAVPSLAAESQRRVVRVAFVEVPGLLEKEADGTRHGLVVDYLNEIAKYTGWDYEYVDTDTETMLGNFTPEHFELMGGNYYLPGLEDHYAYPDYNIGCSKAALLARKEDDTVRSSDLRSLNGKTIGVYDRATENIRRLKQFLETNNIECSLVSYSYEQLTSDGTLYPYLESGEVDLVLGNIAEQDDSFRVVVSYDSQPYYIVTNVGNQEILDGLNMAMERISDSNPNFAAERYAANFLNNSSVDIYLTQEEQEYIRQMNAIKVAIPSNFHPFSCLDTEETHDGVVYDMLKEIAAFTGLEFSYVYADSYIGAIELVQQGEADVLGFYLDSEADSVKQDLALTAPYLSLNSIIVRNKVSNFPAPGLVGAVIEGRDLPNDIQAEEVHKFRSTTEALAAVNRGEVDFLYGMAASLEQEIQRNHFSNVLPMTLVNDRNNVSFALPRPADPELLTILNKAVNHIPSEKKNKLLDQNLVTIGTSGMSITELIYANPVMFIGILSVILLTLVAAVLWINRTKMKAAVIQNNLEKAEAESRAKGEFLSRMSHELRTPMNAVIGLSDLACMAEDVPESVQTTLAKLRASSQYLLDLINDILDMSRLDSGMLTIASESFSLERLLHDLQAMMEPEAQRRGLNYRLEKSLSHAGVSGDAIRLRQVLTNLLSNAFKFTPQGGSVCLRVTETGSTPTEAAFRFQVTDNGVGIAPEEQERIFKTFEQVGTNYSKSQGTGLGLAISRNIVHLMGGELAVNSRPGQGSEFYFTVTLPLCGVEETPREEPEALAASGLLEGVQILLAEDNDLNAEIATQLLSIQGAAVCRTENGKLTVERFAESKPGEFQAILMDIQMPEMNGLEAAKAIRKLPRPDALSIPIVAMTANAFQEDMDAAMEAGMNGFASKPLDVQHLYRLLHSLLKKEKEA